MPRREQNLHRHIRNRRAHQVITVRTVLHQPMIEVAQVPGVHPEVTVLHHRIHVRVVVTEAPLHHAVVAVAVIAVVEVVREAAALPIREVQVAAPDLRVARRRVRDAEDNRNYRTLFLMILNILP